MAQEGWTCPKCGFVWAPWVEGCSNCNQAVGTYVTYSGGDPMCEHSWQEYYDTGGHYRQCVKCMKIEPIPEPNTFTICSDGEGGVATFHG